MGEGIDGTRGRADTSRAKRAGACVLGVIVLLMGLALSVPIARAAAQTASDNPGSLTIQIPAPHNNVASGPVGTNVSFNANGLSQGDSYQVGYALQSVTCDAGFTPFQGVTLNASGNGNATATVSWPGAANQVGTNYYLCLQDTTNSGTPDVVSAQTFQVTGTTAPSITVTAATPTTGPATGQNGDNGAITVPDGPITIAGQNFLENVSIAVYLVNRNPPAPSDLNKQSLLPTNGNVTPDSGGYFTTTVTLPQGYAKAWTLVVATTDGTPSLLPSLVTTAPLNIAPAPTATPTPKPSPTTTTSPQASPTQSGAGGNGSNKPASQSAVAGVVGLSALAIILFIAGVLLLASTLTTPRRPL